MFPQTTNGCCAQNTLCSVGLAAFLKIEYHLELVFQLKLLNVCSCRAHLSATNFNKQGLAQIEPTKHATEQTQIL